MTKKEQNDLEQAIITLHDILAQRRHDNLCRANTALMLLINTIRYLLYGGGSTDKILSALSQLETAMYGGFSIDNS